MGLKRKAPLKRKTGLTAKPALMRSEPMKRKTPMRNKAPNALPRSSTLAHHAKPVTAAVTARKSARARAERKWRAGVRERSKGQCEFERKVDVETPESARGWIRCACAGGQTAHIYRRWQCGGLVFDPRLSIDACGECHAIYDARTVKDVVRVPQRFAAEAYDLIERHTLTPPKGERPEPSRAA